MSEKSTFTETLRAGTPVHVGGVTLVPIEHVALQSEMGIVGAWFSVAKQPYALIVRDDAGIRIIDYKIIYRQIADDEMPSCQRKIGVGFE